MRKITNTLAIAALLMATWFCLPASVQTTIANNAADMSGKIVMVADSATGRTVTNLFTFNRGAAVPFAVGASSLKVTNLDADKLDGLDGVKYGTVTIATTATGAQNNFDPSSTIALNYQVTLIKASNAADLTISGFVAGFDGQIITIRNYGGGGAIFLSHNSGSSSVGNRLSNVVTVGNTPISTNGFATYQYDSTAAIWVMISNDQGAWLTPTFAAGTYTASGGGTWTVGSGDVGTFAYRVSGRQLSLSFVLNTTTVAGTVTSLNMTIPNSFVAAKAMYNPVFIVDAATGNLTGICNSSIASGAVTCTKTNAANFTAGADISYLFGQIAVELQ